MRLLNTRTLQLEEFGGDKNPQYAILSHTWGADEVTFQDLQKNGVLRGQERFAKIEGCCTIAAADGFDLVWIDTCCIDKTSSSELSEAINSMYRWYQEAEVCYAYLADVTYPEDLVFPFTTFSKSRWFTRGWTLQELISPSTVVFFANNWQEIGTKGNLPDLISKITGVHPRILMGESPETVSIAQRMFWASKRETTRIEDLAYCLMGLFGINMPMLYGEGEHAFIRLEEEIMKISDDHSIFAWRTSYMAPHDGSILATSPRFFSDSGNIIRCDNARGINAPITISNVGDHLTVPLEDLRRVHRYVGVLNCRDLAKPDTQLGIYLRDVSVRRDIPMQSKQYFVRERCHIMDQIHVGKIQELPLTNICVLRGRSARRDDRRSQRQLIIDPDFLESTGSTVDPYPGNLLDKHSTTMWNHITLLDDGSIAVILFHPRHEAKFAVALRKRGDAIQCNLILDVRMIEDAKSIYHSFETAFPESISMGDAVHGPNNDIESPPPEEEPDLFSVGPAMNPDIRSLDSPEASSFSLESKTSIIGPSEQESGHRSDVRQSNIPHIIIDSRELESSDIEDSISETDRTKHSSSQPAVRPQARQQTNTNGTKEHNIEDRTLMPPDDDIVSTPSTRISRQWQDESLPRKVYHHRGYRGRVSALIKRQIKEIPADTLAIPTMNFGPRFAAQTQKVAFDVLEIRMETLGGGRQGRQTPLKSDVPDHGSVDSLLYASAISFPVDSHTSIL